MKNEVGHKIWIIICLLIVLTIGQMAGAQTFPPDAPGYTFSQIGYTIRFTGNTVGAQRPQVEDLLDITGPDCAHVEVVDAWDCQNPMRNGSISLLYGYTLQIYADPGCEGQLCIHQINYPKSDDVCYDFGDDLKIEALILDNCGNVIKDREMPYPYLVDLDEVIKFYVKITKDDPTIEFPQAIEGRVLSCGHEYTDVFVYNRYEDEDSVIYKSHYDIKPRDFMEFCNAGPLIFEVRWGRTARYTIGTCEVKFRIIDVIFSNDLPIYSGSSNPVVCYPFGEFLTFGTEVDVLLDGWPYIDTCDALPATVTGYSPGIQPVVMDGSLAGGDFITSQTQTSYHIDDHFREEVLDFDFKVSVLYGPERNPLPGEDQIKVYHGYRANPPNYSGLSEGDEVVVLNEIDMNAKPYPFLEDNPRILYQWVGEGVGEHQGNGNFIFFFPIIGKLNSFTPTYPGDYKIYYRILDLATGLETELPEEYHKIIHIKPQINILQPVLDLDISFNDDPAAKCDIFFSGSAVPGEFADDLHWEMEEIENVNIVSSLGIPAIGDAGYFQYVNLPLFNNEFGQKTISARLDDYATAEERTIYIFYDKDSDNNRTSDDPNWFHFWQQAEAVPNMDGVLYNPDFVDTLYGNHDTGVITIGPMASLQLYKDQGIEINGIIFGGISVRGIDCTANVVAHERYHEKVYNNWMPGGEWFNTYGPHSDINDRDGDWLPNEYEVAVVRSDPDDPDTFDLEHLKSPKYADDGDQEYKAMLEARGTIGVHSLDWSAGTYSKQWHQPH